MTEQRHLVDADDLADPPNRVRSAEQRVSVSRADAPRTTTETTSRRVETVSREHRAHEYPARSADEFDVELPEAMNLRHDRVRWGPIVAGLVTALTSLLLLSLLGLTRHAREERARTCAMPSGVEARKVLRSRASTKGGALGHARPSD